MHASCLLMESLIFLGWLVVESQWRMCHVHLLEFCMHVRSSSCNIANVCIHPRDRTVIHVPQWRRARESGSTQTRRMVSSRRRSEGVWVRVGVWGCTGEHARARCSRAGSSSALFAAFAASNVTFAAYNLRAALQRHVKTPKSMPAPMSPRTTKHIMHPCRSAPCVCVYECVCVCVCVFVCVCVCVCV